MPSDAKPKEEESPLITGEGLRRSATSPENPSTQVQVMMRMARSGTLRPQHSAPLDWHVRLRADDDAELEEGMWDNTVFGGIVDNTIEGDALSPDEAATASLEFAPFVEERLSNSNSRKPLRVVAFVNSASGGQIGAKILDTFKNLFITRQSSSVSSGFTGEVCDLREEGEPEATVRKLAWLLDTNDVRLLVCGGDGTVTWLLNVMDNCNELKDRKDELPVAIMPLGTGNDLARSLGWGAKLSTVSGIPAYIKMVLQAEPVVLDQWCVMLRPHEDLPERHKLHTPGSHPRLVEKPAAAEDYLRELEEALPPVADHARKGKVYIGHFQNYFSVGIDAKIAQMVEHSRTKTCCGRWCFRRGCGKVCYVMQALRHAFCNRLLSRTIEPLALKPPKSSPGDDFQPAWSAPYDDRTGSCCACRHNVRQLMMVNINRYAAGQKVQPDPKSVKNPPSPNDEALELMQVPNALRSFAIFAGARPQYLAAAEAVAFTMWTGQVLQIDGEAWEFEHGCDVLVRPHRKVTMLRVPDETPPSCMRSCTCQRPEPDFWDQEG